MVSSVWIRVPVVFVCLAIVFNSVCSIKIDNQLKVITNDCYERLAIGHRLSSKDVYKTAKANTVPKCQKECTAEGDICKAFTFGIGEKGNSTCELGKNFIRETATLRPIGTIENVDFDLYIKKLGCKLVIEPHASKPNFNDVQLSQSASIQEQYESSQDGPKPSYVPDKPNVVIIDVKPPQSDAYPSEALNKPSDIPQKPSVTYGVNIPNLDIAKPSSYGNRKPSNSYTRPQEYQKPSSHGAQLIQGSLVSVSPGLQSYLHPVHDILIGENPYSYGKPKPNRPLGYLPEISNSDQNGYMGNNNYARPLGGYEDGGLISNVYKKPNDYDRYKLHGGERPERPWGPEFIDNPKFLSPFDPYYDERPIRRPPMNSYNDNPPSRPSSGGYNNEIPGSSYSSGPLSNTDTYSGGRPPSVSTNPYDDERPGYSYNKPQKPLNSYDFPSAHEPSKPFTDKPFKPVHEKPEDIIPHRPHEDQIPPFRPPHLYHPYDDERPINLNRPRPGGYDSRPEIIDDRIDAPYYGRPHSRPHFSDYFSDSKPPKLDFEIPRPMGNNYNDRPYHDRDRPRPGDDYKRPNDDSYKNQFDLEYNKRPLRPEPDHRRPEHDYRRPLRPDDEIRRPPRPEDDYRRPFRPADDYKRPFRPEEEYRKPLRPEDDYHMPLRPADDYRRPSRPENDHRFPPRPDDEYRRPLRPDDEFWRPGNDKGYPRPDFHDRRPYDQRRPLRQPEDPNFGYRNPDYLFSSNDRNDVISNSTKYVNSNKGDVVKTNETNTVNNTDTISDKNVVGNKETDKNMTRNNTIVTESNGVDGEKIVSIITPLENACYRRVLAGKRIARRFVRRSLFCERLEDCQLECAEERRFTCEGFNYRLDPTGRGKGECELLDVPLQRLDIGRDVFPDREYDYYEKDRNAAATNCRYEPPYPDHGGGRPTGYRPPHDGYLPYDRRPGYDVRPPDYHRRPPMYDGRPYEGRPSGYDHDRRPPINDYDRRRPPVYDRRPPPPRYGPEYDRRGGKDSPRNEPPDVLCVHLKKK